VLKASLARLDEYSADVDAAWSLCQAYVSLGLFGPARELLTNSQGPLSGRTECRDLAKKIANMPSGRMAWGPLQAQFDRHANRLFACKPQLTHFHAAFRNLPRDFELYRASDGAILLSTRTANGRRWLLSAGSAPGLAENVKLAHADTDSFCGNYLIAADKCFALLGRVFASTTSMLLGFSPRIFLLDPDPRRFAVGLYVCRSIDPLLHPRTIVFIGERCLDDLETYLNANPSVNPPAYQICLPTDLPDFERRLTTTLQRVSEGRLVRARETIQQIDSIYTAKSPAYWRQRFHAAGARPLSVLGITSRFTTVLQYTMRDMRAAFERKGHRFHTLIEPNDHDMLDGAAFARAVAESQPDLIFVIDHHRAEYPHVLPENVPYVCWIQDMLPHLTNTQAGRRLGSLDFFIASNIRQLARSYQYPADRGLLWTTCTDHRLYSNEPLPDAELDPFRCDFSYVSNQSTPPEVFHQRQRQAAAAPGGAVALLDAIFEILKQDFRAQPSTAGTRPAMLVLEDAAAAAGVQPASPQIADLMARTYIHPLAELMFRQSTLEWVADYCQRRGRTLRLYGNGWGSHPRLARWAAGVAPNGCALRAIYQATAINLQINGYSAVHPRLLDGLASGGFFLIRHTPFDTLARPVQRLLSVIQNSAIQPDTDYDPAQVPEFADALRQVCALRGQRVPAVARIAAADFDLYNELAADAYRRCADAVLPGYDDVRFATSDEFSRLADRYLQNPDDRKPVVKSMSQRVIESFSYDTLVDRLLAFVAAALSATPDAAPLRSDEDR
jgi:hypothetical protein